MAQMQPVGSLTIDDLRSFVTSDLRTAFPNEEFLDEELARIVGGVFNAFNWGIIRMATERGIEALRANPIDSVETVDHLATRWMGRADIVHHAMDTTGLSSEVVELGLKRIEFRIDMSLLTTGYVHVGWLGTVSRSKYEGGYRIALSDELRFS